MATAFERELEIFSRAVECRTQEERAGYLREACAGDEGIRQRIEGLLHAHDAAEGFLPATQTSETLTMRRENGGVTETVGDRIGRYKLREKIGEGGCGVVYVADQEEPVRRRVALKIIKLGMDTRSVMARFEAERQALAMMDHPNIAKVLDAGATETGRPFFVMELVRGIRITDYCDQHKLSTAARLDLFIKVCQAVQHAHQKGIIHRDLKPSNILVTLHDGVPVPKIIDFGIAKATEGRLTQNTVYTELHQFIGTPAYMSPEQAEMSGLDIDTRSDIYSLGVLLYELLTGGTPFDGRELIKAGLDAMRRTIREEEPQRPSTRLSNLQMEMLTMAAQRRGAEAPRLVSLIRGDLDWIVMKCLEKDRTRRYESASGLAADLKRHLVNEPVVARPPTTAYRIQKAIRRNRLAFGAAAAVVLALGLGVVGSTWQAVRATRAEREQGRLAESEGKQRVLAEASERRALDAKTEAETQRQTAEGSRKRAEALAYAADIDLAQRALQSNNLGEARQLLELHRPSAGQEAPSWEWRYLWAQSRGDAPKKLWQFSDYLRYLQNSNDDHWLAVGGEKSGLSLWDISNPRAMKKVAEIGDLKVEFAFSPKDALYAVGGPVSEGNSKQFKIQLANAATNSVIKEIPLGEYAPLGMQFTSDGSRLVVMTQHLGFKVSVLSVPDGHIEGTYTSPPMPSAPIMDKPVLIFDHDTAFAFGGFNGDMELHAIDLNTMKERWSTQGELPKDGVRKGMGAILSADAQVLFSLDFDLGERLVMRLQQRDMRSGKPANAQMWELSQICFDLQFLDEGKTFVTANEDQTLQMWDMSDPSRLTPKGDPFRGHTASVTCLTLLHDGKTMFSGSADGALYAWDLTAARGHAPCSVLKGAAKAALAFTGDGKGLLMMDEEGRFYEAPRLDFKNRKLLVDTGGKPDGCQWNNGGQLVTAKGGTFKLWDYQKGKLIKEFGSYKGKGDVKSVSTDGKDVIIVDIDPRLFRQWDLTTFTEKGSWPTASTNREFRNCVSPDHRLFLTSDLDGMLTIRDLVKGTETKKQLDVHDVLVLKFSRDGKFFAVSSVAGYAEVFDTATMEKMAKVGDLRSGIYNLEFSPDDRQLVTHELGFGRMQLWDIQTQRELLTFTHPFAPVTPAVFSPDGRYLSMSVGDDEYLWEAPTWEEIQAAERAQRP